MLIPALRHHHQPLLRLLALSVLLSWSFLARAQDAVSVLKASVRTEATAAPVTTDAAVDFTLHRNLIFFEAAVDGRSGNYILDTGAPTLLLNHRGAAGRPATDQEGVGTGGAVALSNRKVSSFVLNGQQLGQRWALALDLRGMERRMGVAIDGYVGQQLLRNRELRIDFANRRFELRASVRQPLYEGRPPRQTLRFTYADHLPVITLRVGNRKLRFALDTGAGVSLLDERFAELAAATGSSMNIQGLDGTATDYPLVRIPDLSCWADEAVTVNFTLLDLAHLQAADGAPIAGILGADFLRHYAVGIDYRRRRVYFW